MCRIAVVATLLLLSLGVVGARVPERTGFPAEGTALRASVAAGTESRTRRGVTERLTRPVRDAARPGCTAEPDGDRPGLPQARQDRPMLTLTCVPALTGKCSRSEDQPWRFTADGRPLRDIRTACVHMT